MEDTEQKQESYFFFYLNAAIQLAAILIYQNMLIVWPFYIVMCMLGILIFMQTIAAAAVFSNVINVNLPKDKKPGAGIGILISIIYMVSCYHIYLIGYVGFAWFALAHVIIQFLGTTFGAMKK